MGQSTHKHRLSFPRIMEESKESIMGIRGFHIIFSILCVLLTSGFAGWCFRMYQQTQKAGYIFGVIASLIAAVWLPFYLWRFLKKSGMMKSVILALVVFLGLGVKE